MTTNEAGQTLAQILDHHIHEAQGYIMKGDFKRANAHIAMCEKLDEVRRLVEEVCL